LVSQTSCGRRNHGTICVSISSARESIWCGRTLLSMWKPFVTARGSRRGSIDSARGNCAIRWSYNKVGSPTRSSDDVTNLDMKWNELRVVVSVQPTEYSPWQTCLINLQNIPDLFPRNTLQLSWQPTFFQKARKHAPVILSFGKRNLAVHLR
jgi:hypothetical protein